MLCHDVFLTSNLSLLLAKSLLYNTITRKETPIKLVTVSFMARLEPQDQNILDKA